MCVWCRSLYDHHDVRGRDESSQEDFLFRGREGGTMGRLPFIGTGLYVVVSDEWEGIVKCQSGIVNTQSPPALDDWQFPEQLVFERRPFLPNRPQLHGAIRPEREPPSQSALAEQTHLGKRRAGPVQHARAIDVCDGRRADQDLADVHQLRR